MMAKIIGNITEIISSAGVKPAEWNSFIADLAAKEKQRKEADRQCLDAQWGVEKRRLERELRRRMTRRERKAARAKWLAESA